MTEKDGAKLFGHTVIIYLRPLDDAIHLGLIFGEEEINIRGAGIVLYTNDAIILKIFEDVTRRPKALSL